MYINKEKGKGKWGEYDRGVGLTWFVSWQCQILVRVWGS